MVSSADGRIRAEAWNGGSSVGGCGEAGGRLQAEERAGKDSRARINNSTLNKPPMDTGEKICLQQMQALIYKFLQTFKEQEQQQKKVGNSMLFNIIPVTSKQRTGDKPEAEGKRTRRRFFCL